MTPAPAADDQPEAVSSTAGPGGSAGAPSPTETIMLSVPASGPYGRIARMSGAALALRRGLSLSAVEDLRLAIDEAIILLLGHRNHEGSIDLEIALEPNAIGITFVPNFDEGPPDLTAEGIERFAELAGPLLSTFEIDSATGTVGIHIGPS